jgi:hypothetical protein
VQAPTDQAKLAVLLLLYRRLSAAYEPVILHLQGLAKQDFPDAVAQLKESERRVLDNDADQKGADTALSAGKQAKKGPPPGFKVGERYHCHSMNHKRPECPEYLKTPEGKEKAQKKATATAAAATEAESTNA